MLLSDVWLSSDKVRLYTDSAMSAGYAAVYGRRWFNGSWPEGWQGYHITVLELYPIVAAVCVCGHILANHCVLFMCDNMSVVEIINKLSSKYQHVMSLMRRFIIETMKYNILFKCKHVPGKSNIVADHLSRFQVAQALNTFGGYFEQCSMLPQLPKCRSTVDTIGILSNITCY